MCASGRFLHLEIVDATAGVEWKRSRGLRGCCSMKIPGFGNLSLLAARLWGGFAVGNFSVHPTAFVGYSLQIQGGVELTYLPPELLPEWRRDPAHYSPLLARSPARSRSP